MAKLENSEVKSLEEQVSEYLKTSSKGSDSKKIGINQIYQTVIVKLPMYKVVRTLEVKRGQILTTLLKSEGYNYTFSKVSSTSKSNDVRLLSRSAKFSIEMTNKKVIAELSKINTLIDKCWISIPETDRKYLLSIGG